MGLGRRASTLLVPVVLGLAWLSPAVAGAAPPEARSLTVTPSDDLDDGQTVTVDGTGWRPGVLVFAIECLAGTQTCGGAVANRPVATDGAFTMTIVVRAVFTAFDGTPVDCRVDDCEVTAVNEANEDHTASVPITFDPATVLLPPPTLTVTPDTDLVDGQTVEVAGTGFIPGVSLALAQCAAGETDIDDCRVAGLAEVDGAGVLSDDTDIDVATSFPTAVADVDCRVEACELVAASFAGGILARAALGFDTDAPLRPSPTLRVTPQAGLVDGQAVRVQGAGFRRGTTVLLVQCRDGATSTFDGCMPTNALVADVGPDGVVSEEVTVRAVIVPLVGGSDDCRVDPCVVRAFVVEDDLSVDAPISFAPGAAGAPPPAAPVAPRFTG